MCPKVWHIILLYLSNYVVNNGTPKTGFSEHGCPTLFVHKIESIKRVKYEKGGWSSFIKSSISLNRGSLNRGSLNRVSGVYNVVWPQKSFLIEFVVMQKKKSTTYLLTTHQRVPWRLWLILGDSCLCSNRYQSQMPHWGLHLVKDHSCIRQMWK